MTITKCYTKKLEECKESNVMACAKEVTNDEGKVVGQYVKYNDAEGLLNPFEKLPYEVQGDDWKFIKVTPKVYELYTRFLKSGSTILFKNAERQV